MEDTVVFTSVLNRRCCENGGIHYGGEGFEFPACDSCGAAPDLSAVRPVSNGWSYYDDSGWVYSEDKPIQNVRRLRQIIDGVLQPCGEDL